MNDIKEKIIIFAIGLLAGAVITTGAFCVYTLTNNSKCGNNAVQQMPGGQQPSMNNDSNNKSGNQNGQPPEKPDENNSQNTQDNNN